MVDPHPLAGDDADAEDVTPLPRQPGNGFDHGVVHVLVGAELDRLIFPVIIHHARITGNPPVGDEDIEEGVGDPELELVEAQVFHIPLPFSQIGGVEDHHQL